MGRNVLLLGLICVVVPALVCAGSGPRIHVGEQEHDFGDITYGRSASFEFTVSNVGDTDLVFERVASSCGCAKAMREKSTLSPGESAKIYTKIHTRGMSPGKHRKTFAVHSNDPENPVTVLKLLFNVVRSVSIQPDSMATSVSSWDKPAVFVLSATNQGSTPVTLKLAKRKEPREVSLEPPEVVVAPGAKVDFQLSVQLSEQPSQPYISGNVHIEADVPRGKRLLFRYFIRLLTPGGA